MSISDFTNGNNKLALSASGNLHNFCPGGSNGSLSDSDNIHDIDNQEVVNIKPCTNKWNRLALMFAKRSNIVK